MNTRSQTIPVAADRDESESCQKGTPGCCVDHSQQIAKDPATGERFGWTYDRCETW
jgi:hypothetical protein